MPPEISLDPEIADKYYVGSTDNPHRRLEEHNITSEHTYTSKYRPWELKAYAHGPIMVAWPLFSPMMNQSATPFRGRDGINFELMGIIGQTPKAFSIYRGNDYDLN